MQAGVAPGRPINLGNPEEITVSDLAATVQHHVGTSRMVFEPLPFDDPRRLRPDIALARELFGWQPTVRLREGLSATVDHFRQTPRGAADKCGRPCLSQRRGSGASGMTRLESEIRAFGPWFHNLRIDGIETAPEHFLCAYPEHKWNRFRDAVLGDVEGRSVLDIGCNADFHALKMKQRHAGQVVAVDSDPRYLRQAEFAIRHSGHHIELKQMSV